MSEPYRPLPPQGGVSASDILTAIKNLTAAVSSALSAYKQVQGEAAKTDITSATLVKQGAGRVCVVSITAAGSASGMIYDANQATSTANPIYVIPQSAGVIVVNMPVSNGIVVAPGTGQVVTVSYS